MKWGCCKGGGGSMKRDEMLEPPISQHAGGTHPTGMHSCFHLKRTLIPRLCFLCTGHFFISK